MDECVKNAPVQSKQDIYKPTYKSINANFLKAEDGLQLGSFDEDKRIALNTHSQAEIAPKIKQTSFPL